MMASPEAACTPGYGVPMVPHGYAGMMPQGYLATPGMASTFPGVFPDVAAGTPAVAAGMPGTKISTSVSMLKKIPKMHQVDGIQQLDSRLDSTLTGALDQEELSVIVWLLTHMKPDFKMHDLRCDTYEEIFANKLMGAAQRVKDRPQ